jgi:hypothetical protein
MAILNQFEQTTGQGNINPVPYSLASNPTSYATVFHDITSGSNSCIPGTSSCAAPGESGYAATPGYDEATGLGSIDFGNLAKAWPSSATTKLMQTNIVINGEAIANPGDSVTIQIIVQSVFSPVAAFIPTGGVAVSLDGTVVDPSLAFPSTNPSNFSSTVSYTFIAPSTAGSHLIRAIYPGDATHSPSVATYSVLVGNVKPSGTFTLAAGNLTVANGNTGSTQVTVTPAGGYNGRLMWSLGSSGNPGNLCYGIGSPAVNGPSMTTLTIGVGSACNFPKEGGEPIAQAHRAKGDRLSATLLFSRWKETQDSPAASSGHHTSDDDQHGPYRLWREQRQWRKWQRRNHANTRRDDLYHHTEGHGFREHCNYSFDDLHANSGLVCRFWQASGVPSFAPLRKTISRLSLTVERRRVRDRDLLDRIKFGNLSI